MIPDFIYIILACFAFGMEDQLRNLLAEYFQMDLSVMSEEDINPLNIPLWHSDSHHSLVTEVEKAFEITAEFEDIGIMFEGFESIMEILEKHLGK